MDARKFVAYYRVSTAKQGQSGLGLEAQRASVNQFLAHEQSQLVAEFQEIESAKGANAIDKRPQLRAALTYCRRTKSTLLIAKLDRLARNVHFVSGLIEEGCDFVAADMPQANKVMLHMHSVMAEWERDQISARTKAALAAAKARGVQLGRAGPANLRRNNQARSERAQDFADRLSGTLNVFCAQGLSQRKIINKLNELGCKAPNGGLWSLVQLQRVLKKTQGGPHAQGTES